MAEFDKNTALIDQYLSGEMTAQEKTEFEQLLKTDEQLQQELLLHQEISKGIALAGEEMLQKELDGYHEELVKGGGTLNKPWVKVGLGLLGVLSIGLLVMVIINVAQKAKELEAKHTKPVVADTATLKKEVVEITDTTEITVEPDSKETAPTVEKPQLITKQHIIHHYVHESSPSYTFKGKELQLFNFDYSLRAVDLRIHDNEVYLFHNKSYYLLKTGAESQPLQKLDDVREFETLKYATGTGPKVTITNQEKYELKEEETITLILHPAYNGQEVKLDKVNNQLTISKEVDLAELKISRYGQGESMYVLEIGEQRYLLKEQVKHVPELLEEEKAFPKEQVAIPVRHETIEDSYHLEESN